MQQMNLCLPPVTSPEVLRAHRERAGLSQAAAAKLVFLGHKARWELFLLLTGQHPHYAPLATR